MADYIDLSDHRPVCGAFEMTLDKQVQNFTRDGIDAGHDDEEEDMMGFTFSFTRLQYHEHVAVPLSNVQCEQQDSKEEEEEEGSGSEDSGGGGKKQQQQQQHQEHQQHGTPREVTVVFPIASEDPMYEERVASTFCEVNSLRRLMTMLMR